MVILLFASSSLGSDQREYELVAQPNDDDADYGNSVM